MEQDSVNKEELYLGFNPAYALNYKVNEDADYLAGDGNIHFYSYTSDHVAVAINQMPLPQKQALVVPLSVTASSSGTYQIRQTELSGIPALFDVYLVDTYKKDSVNLRNTTVYSFTISNADTSSYGGNRFQVKIRENPLLMVQLINFTASGTAAGVQVKWTVSNENNYTGFTVERSTDGGHTYTALTSSTSTGVGSYSYTDSNPVKGTDQYRLKMTDINGTVSYSTVVPLTIGDALQVASNITVYPNPASTVLNYTVQGSSIPNVTKGYHINIYDMDGGVVLQSETGTGQSSTGGQLEVGKLKPGTYILRLTNTNDGTIVGITRFIKCDG